MEEKIEVESKLELVAPEFVEGAECTDVSNDEALFILSEVVSDMVKLIRENNGEALAAPQVGIYKNFFVMVDDKGYAIIFNPRLAIVDSSKAKSMESCLTYPGQEVPMTRLKKIKMMFQVWDKDANGLVDKSHVFKNFDARVIQHEVDHLHGKTLFYRG